MPTLSGNQSNTITGQQLLNQLKSNPEFYNLLGGAGGYSTEPGHARILRLTSTTGQTCWQYWIVN